MRNLGFAGCYTNLRRSCLAKAASAEVLSGSTIILRTCSGSAAVAAAVLHCMLLLRSLAPDACETRTPTSPRKVVRTSTAD